MERVTGPGQQADRTMSGGRLLKIAVGVLVVGFIAMNVPDLIRYVRISNM